MGASWAVADPEEHLEGQKGKEPPWWGQTVPGELLWVGKSRGEEWEKVGNPLNRGNTLNRGKYIKDGEYIKKIWGIY